MILWLADVFRFDEGRWLLVGQLRGREFSQLVIDQWQQLVCRARIALFDLREDLGDVVHSDQNNGAKRAIPSGTANALGRAEVSRL